MSIPGFKKDYVLVSSSELDATSQSTTDFRVKLSVPLQNVVKTDLVQVVMDYKVANIVAPYNGFRVTEAGNNRLLTLEEGLYTPYSLRETLEGILGDPFLVTITADDRLSIERPLSELEAVGHDIPTNILAGGWEFYVANATLRTILGLTNATFRPTYNASDGTYGSLTWRFPGTVKLGQLSPFLFIQSPELGTDIRTAGGQVGFWRMILNDTYNGFVQMVNNRVDSYTDTPRTLQDINVKLLFPDGTVVNNRGGSFTMLLEIVRKV